MKKRKKQIAKSSKLVVLPHAVEATEQELLILLKREQWQDAMERLDWLLDLPAQPLQKREEWTLLRDALPTQRIVKTDFELDEHQLFVQMMRDKSKYDPDSVKRTLNILQKHPSPDQQLLALEQLTYMEHPEITNQIVRWLVDHVHPSRLQFRALQALKQRGFEQEVLVRKASGLTWIEVQTIPLNREDWPNCIVQIGSLATNKCADYFPSFVPLLQNFWDDFLHWVYLDDFYKVLSTVQDEDIPLWADALVREGFFAWTGSEAQETEWVDLDKSTSLRQQLRPFFQPHGS